MEIHWWLAGISTMWTRGTKAGDAGKLHCRRGIESIKEHGGSWTSSASSRIVWRTFPTRFRPRNIQKKKPLTWRSRALTCIRLYRKPRASFERWDSGLTRPRQNVARQLLAAESLEQFESVRASAHLGVWRNFTITDATADRLVSTVRRNSNANPEPPDNKRVSRRPSLQFVNPLPYYPRTRRGHLISHSGGAEMGALKVAAEAVTNPWRFPEDRVSILPLLTGLVHEDDGEMFCRRPLWSTKTHFHLPHPFFCCPSSQELDRESLPEFRRLAAKCAAVQNCRSRPISEGHLRIRLRQSFAEALFGPSQYQYPGKPPSPRILF